MTQTNKERVVIVELLRIVDILFIITHHLLYFTMNWDSELDALSATNIIHVNVIAFVEPFLIIGVNLFFLISGYFGIHFKVRKIIHIILVFYLYIFLLQIIGLLTGVNRFEFGFIKQTLLYIKEYWYITVYIILFLKFMCFDGEQKFVWVDIKRFANHGRGNL
jgi:surface polysaccharide O-acyltransferase-like enzyme